MTTIALLPPPLERLFDRIVAAEPSDAYLRGLFGLVGETKEPIAAGFGERGHFEVLVAPLSSQDSKVDAVSGSIVRR